MKELSYETLLEWQKEGKEFQLIDVREPEEHDAYDIGGELIPLPAILSNLSRLDSSRPIVFYCKRGIRSQIAIQRISQKIHHDALYNLKGGIQRLFNT